MPHAIFASRAAAAVLMEKSGRTWTTVSTRQGVYVRAFMPWGWAYVSQIDAHHLEMGAY